MLGAARSTAAFFLCRLSRVTSVSGFRDNFILKRYIGASRDELIRSRILVSLYATYNFEVLNFCLGAVYYISPNGSNNMEVLVRKGLLPCFHDIPSAWAILKLLSKRDFAYSWGVRLFYGYSTGQVREKGGDDEKVWTIAGTNNTLYKSNPIRSRSILLVRILSVARNKSDTVHLFWLPLLCPKHAHPTQTHTPPGSRLGDGPEHLPDGDAHRAGQHLHHTPLQRRLLSGHDGAEPLRLSVVGPDRHSRRSLPGRLPLQRLRGRVPHPEPAVPAHKHQQ